ncbi:MAG: hypothetical protein J3Q66DRAFT_110397, partial [Benniella sp.]
QPVSPTTSPSHSLQATLTSSSNPISITTHLPSKPHIMKFTSVILTLSAVVAMVQAAPIVPVDGLTGALPLPGSQESLSKRDIIGVDTEVRKRDIDLEIDTDVNISKRDINANVDATVDENVNVDLRKRGLAESTLTDIGVIQNTIGNVVANVAVSLEATVQAEVTVYFEKHFAIPNIVSVDASVAATIRAVIDVAIANIYPGLNGKINDLVDNAAASTNTVDVKSLVPGVSSLITDIVTQVVVAVDVLVLSEVAATVKVLGKIDVPVKVAAGVKVGLDIKAVVGKVLSLPAVEKDLTKNLVQ